MKLCVGGAIGLIVAAGLCRAAPGNVPGILWENTTITLTPKEGAKAVSGEYRFVNASPDTVEIKSVTPSCGCLRVVSDKQSYGSGEAGIIRADYTLTGGEESVDRTVKVDFGVPAGSHELKAILDMREPVRITPRSLSWQVGEPAQSKRFTVTVADPAKVSLTSVQCADSRFAVALVASEQPRVFHVDVTPVSTVELAGATIRLNARVGTRPTVLVLTARIR